MSLLDVIEEGDSLSGWSHGLVRVLGRRCDRCRRARAVVESRRRAQRNELCMRCFRAFRKEEIARRQREAAEAGKETVSVDV